MEIKEKLKNIINASEKELKEAIFKKYERLEALEVQPKEVHIRPSVTPVVYRNYINSKKSNVEITGGFDDGEILSYRVDNTKEVFENFAAKVRENKPNSDGDFFWCVTQTIFDYIGGAEVVGGLEDRLGHLGEGKENGLSSFKGSHHAWCMERSIMAHQIFKMLGLDAELVVSPIHLDGKIRKDGKIKTEQHAFNVVKVNGKTYLYDATLLDYEKPFEQQNCIVEILPETSYDDLRNINERKFKSKTGAIRTCRYNPKNGSVFIIGDDNGSVNESE